MSNKEVEREVPNHQQAESKGHGDKLNLLSLMMQETHGDKRPTLKDVEHNARNHQVKEGAHEVHNGAKHIVFGAIEYGKGSLDHSMGRKGAGIGIAAAGAAEAKHGLHQIKDAIKPHH